MNKNQRLKEIINLLHNQNFISIATIKTKLQVSEMTARRDLNLLAADKILKLVPGGAIIAPPETIDEEKYQVDQHETLQVREKLNIGQKAASLIKPQDTIILDIGSTTEYVAKFTRQDVPLTVVCHTINNLFEIYRKKNCNIIFPGGYFHSEELMFESSEGINLIRKTRADKAFISAAGVHLELGVTTVYPYELETKQAIMKSAKTKILLVDSTKFGRTRSVFFADLSEFDMVITDSGIPKQYSEKIQELGIKLILV